MYPTSQAERDQRGPGGRARFQVGVEQAARPRRKSHAHGDTDLVSLPGLPIYLLRSHTQASVNPGLSQLLAQIRTPSNSCEGLALIEARCFVAPSCRHVNLLLNLIFDLHEPRAMARGLRDPGVGSAKRACGNRGSQRYKLDCRLGVTGSVRNALAR